MSLWNTVVKTPKGSRLGITVLKNLYTSRVTVMVTDIKLNPQSDTMCELWHMKTGREPRRRGTGVRTGTNTHTYTSHTECGGDYGHLTSQQWCRQTSVLTHDMFRTWCLFVILREFTWYRVQNPFMGTVCVVFGESVYQCIRFHPQGLWERKPVTGQKSHSKGFIFYRKRPC